MAEATTGSMPSAVLTRSDNCSGVGTFIVGRGTRGGVARAVGAVSMYPHLTACLSAADRMQWYLWTVAGERPSANQAR